MLIVALSHAAILVYFRSLLCLSFSLCRLLCVCPSSCLSLFVPFSLFGISLFSIYANHEENLSSYWSAIVMSFVESIISP